MKEHGHFIIVMLTILLVSLILIASGCATEEKESVDCWQCPGDFFDFTNCFYVCNDEKLH